MVSLEHYRAAYLRDNPGATDEEIGRAYLETIGAPTFIDELSSGLQRGAGGIIEAIGAGVRMVSGDTAGRSAVALGQQIVDAAPRHPELVGSILDDPSLLSEPAWWSGGVGEMAPSLALQGGAIGLAAKAGLGMKAAVPAAALAGGALEGLPTYNVLRDQGVDNFEAIGRTSANIGAISTLNLLPLSRAFGGGPTRGAANRLLTTGLAEGVTETAEEPIGAIIEGNDPVQALYDGFNVFPVAALTGGLLGGAGSLTQPGQAPPDLSTPPLQQPPVSPPSSGISRNDEMQQADTAGISPLSGMLLQDETEAQFDETGAQVKPLLSNWAVDKDGNYDYQPDIGFKVARPDFDQDNTLSSLLDAPALFQDYPSLADVQVGKLPEGVDLQSRSVPGRIEVQANLPQQELHKALTREVQRQVSYREGIDIPGLDVEVDADKQAQIDSSVADMIQEFGISPDTTSAGIAMRHAQHVAAPRAAQHINDITQDQGSVSLKLTPQEARTLNQSRRTDYINSIQSQNQVRAEQAAAEVPEGQPQPSDQPDLASSGAAPTADVMVSLPTRVGNLRLDKLAIPDANREAVVALGELEENFINRRRRMPKGQSVPIEQTKMEALAMVAEESGVPIKQLLNRDVGAAYNTEEIYALGALMDPVATQYLRTAGQYNANPTEANRLEAMKAFTNMRKLHSVFSGSKSEAGRALRIQREINEKAKQYAEFNKIFPNFDDAMAAMGSAETNGQLNAIAEEYEGLATKSDVVMEVWLAGLLSGGTTHAVNAVSNAVTAKLYQLELLLAAGVGKLTGNRSVTFRDALAYSMPSIGDVIEGSKQAVNSYRTEADVFEASKLDVHRFKAISSERLGLKKNSVFIDKLGRGIRLPFRLLMSSDAYFKTRAYRRRLRQDASRKVMKDMPNASSAERAVAVKEMVQKPSAKMRQDAIDHANYLTFTNKTGPFAASLRKMTSDFPILKFIIPFISTPVNIIKFAAARTPFAFAMKNSERLALTGKLGPEAQLMARTRVMLGSSIMGLFGYMAATGLITGAPPRDPRERALWYAQNAQPYSIKIGDQWYAYGRIEPLGMLVGMAADVMTMYQFMDGDDKQVQEMLGALTASMAQNLLSKTWLTGISDLTLAIVDPNQYGQRWVNKFTGTLIPTGVAQAVRAEDPMLRYASTVWENLQTRIPGMADNIPPRVDVWGNEISLAPEGTPALVNFFNPIYIRKIENDPVAKEMLRMKVNVSSPRKKIGEYRLSPQEYVDYSRIHGKTTHQMLRAKIASPEYQISPNQRKVELLEKTRRNASKMARQIFYARNPLIKFEKMKADLATQQRFTQRDLLF